MDMLYFLFWALVFTNIKKEKKKVILQTNIGSCWKLYLRSQESLKNLTNPDSKLKEEMMGIHKSKQLWETATAELFHCKYHCF